METPPYIAHRFGQAVASAGLRSMVQVVGPDRSVVALQQLAVVSVVPGMVQRTSRPGGGIAFLHCQGKASSDRMTLVGKEDFPPCAISVLPGVLMSLQRIDSKFWTKGFTGEDEETPPFRSASVNGRSGQGGLRVFLVGARMVVGQSLLILKVNVDR